MARLLSLGMSLCCRRLLSLQLLRVLLLQALTCGGKGGILGLQQCMRACLQCVRVQCGFLTQWEYFLLPPIIASLAAAALQHNTVLELFVSPSAFGQGSQV